LLKLDNLRKWFSIKKGIWGTTVNLKAVDGVSFEVEKGTAISLVGESGSGKTTLGKTILRLYEPTDGRIIFDGTDITHLSLKELKWYRKETSLVQQDPYGALPSNFNIYRILEEPLIINKIGNKEERRELIYKALENVRLLPVEDFVNKYPHMLSGGQLQRVAIARAIIMEPKLVIADEPVSMLDASVRVEILNLLQELQYKQGISFIYITHDLSTTRYFSEWIFIMYAGHIVERARTKELIHNPLHPYTKALLAAIPDPDPDNRFKKRHVPPGEPPNLVNPPKGCNFEPRCEFRLKICGEKEPPEFEVSKDHYVKCWLYEEK
jgi:peptide/nickel transport system ATP-binding protein